MPSRVALTEASASTSTCAPANLARSTRALDQFPEDRLQAVVIAVVEVVGLGRGEENTVDPPGDETGQPASPADAEGGKDRGERGFEIGERRRSGVQRLQRVDENDLAVEAREMIAKERTHDGVLVGGVAAGHHRAERTRRAAFGRCAAARRSAPASRRGRPA